MQTVIDKEDFIYYVYKRVHDDFAPDVPLDYMIHNIIGTTDFPEIKRKAKELEATYIKEKKTYSEIL